VKGKTKTKDVMYNIIAKEKQAIES